MHRTTSRRAASTGLVALAATTALALAAPSAAAATVPVALEPPADATFALLSPSPADEDLLEQYAEDGVLPLPEGAAAGEDGQVVLELPGSVAPLAPGVTAAFLTVEDSFAVEVGETPENPPLLAEGAGLTTTTDDGQVTVTVDAGAVETLDQDLLEDGVGALVVAGLGLVGLPDQVLTTSVLLDTEPDETFTGPLVLQGVGVAGGFLPDPVVLEPGDDLELQLPADGLVRSLGLDLRDAEITLVDLEAVLDEPAGVDDPAGLAGLGVAGLAAVSEDETDDGSDGLVDLEVTVSGDGATASVVLPEGAEPGDYGLDVTFLDPPLEDLEAGDLSGLDLVASVSADVELTAAPEPVPTVTVTAAPPAQNPGLRSNTGVEGGGVDSRLVAGGAALLALAGGAGVLALRTRSRGARA
ncbi:hypothetical protein [Pseudokineococcus sp. 1T1Z-3]|uniref:hypothetical protein n=1 Tax=Pseudokineococcus sp. 1T1Z-3 TaxID=3132745 RepID=UPI0030958D02